MQSNEVNSLNRQYPIAFLAGYLLAGYLITTSLYEGYQIARAIRKRADRRKSSDWRVPDFLGDATIHKSGNIQ